MKLAHILTNLIVALSCNAALGASKTMSSPTKLTQADEKKNCQGTIATHNNGTLSSKTVKKSVPLESLPATIVAKLAADDSMLTMLTPQEACLIIDRNINHLTSLRCHLQNGTLSCLLFPKEPFTTTMKWMPIDYSNKK